VRKPLGGDSDAVRDMAIGGTVASNLLGGTDALAGETDGRNNWRWGYRTTHL